MSGLTTTELPRARRVGLGDMTSKTIIWDIDGVLIWHHPDDPAQDWRRRLLEMDVLALWEAFQASPGWMHCLRDDAIDTRQCFQDFLNKRDITVHADPNVIIDIWLEGNVKPCEPALTKLRELQQQGVPCAVASNQDGLRRARIEGWLERHGLGGLPCFISCLLHTAKPDHNFFRHVERALKSAPDRLILIDDHRDNVVAAEKAGWGGIWIDDSYRLDPARWAALPLPAAA